MSIKINKGQRKGHPALRGRHRTFKITTKSVERWLYHMDMALDEVNINKETLEREALNQFFQHVAHFLINTEEKEKNPSDDDNNNNDNKS